MNPLLAPALLGSLLLAAQQPPSELRKAKLSGVIEVGDVFQNCEQVRKAGRPAETPIGFLITPLAAFQLALRKVQFRCPSLFGNIVFADNDCYYITVGPLDGYLEKAGRDITPARLRASAIRVHGLTGAVFPPENLH